MAKTRETLFGNEVEWDWRDEWWGMPEFVADNRNAAERSVRVNFKTQEDFDAFVRATGLRITDKSHYVWYPQKPPSSAVGWIYDGPQADTRYPVCIPSKGRYDVQTTGRVLTQMGVTHRFFVEETEYDLYCNAVGEQNVVRMPFHDLGQGSIPARNFIWEWAKTHGHARHWVMDDNIINFVRCTENRKLRVRGGRFLQAMEDFVDRYENVAMAGPHNRGFIYAGNPKMTAFLLNTRVYSCILLDTNQPERWRGRVNEDTDLSLRFLKRGLCTVLFRTFLMEKAGTSQGDANKTGGMRGGNTDNVYIDNDHRRKFAEELQQQHPDCVKVVWRYGRFHMDIDYEHLFTQKLIRKPGVYRLGTNEKPVIDNYDMRLRRVDQSEPNATELVADTDAGDLNEDVEVELSDE